MEKRFDQFNGFRDKCYTVNTPRKKWGHGRVVAGICNKHGYHSESGCPKCGVEERIETPNIGNWDPEWAYLSTGKRMSKRELKEYCKKNNKVWENC